MYCQVFTDTVTVSQDAVLHFAIDVSVRNLAACNSDLALGTVLSFTWFSDMENLGDMGFSMDFKVHTFSSR